MSANRIGFLVTVAVLGLLVLAMLVISTGSADQTDLLVSAVRLIVGVGVVLLTIRILRNIAGRR